jgi:hypothetical protein
MLFLLILQLGSHFPFLNSCSYIPGLVLLESKDTGEEGCDIKKFWSQVS